MAGIIMHMYLSDITKHLNGRLIGEDLAVSSFSINTRTLKNNDLFIAIKGQNFDAHNFVENAQRAGAGAVIVEYKMPYHLPQIIVKDSHLALAELSAIWKQQADVKTIAITGSNGKTTVKEMIAAILATNATVLSTKGNLNNDIGVPLTLLDLQQEHQFAVVEMGANHAGEIKYSSQFAKPDVAVITNIGSAHIEGFGSLEATAQAKAEIFQSLGTDGIAIVNKDDPFYPVWIDQLGKQKTISFGVDASANVRAQNISSILKNNAFVTQFKLITANDEIIIQLKLAGQHNVSNALAAAASCLSLGIHLKQIKQGLESLLPVTGRLQPLMGELGTLIIDDTYNANPSSLAVALTVLTQCKGEPWVIFGALAEMGRDSKKIHHDMGVLIKSMGITRLFAIGEDAHLSCQAFAEGAEFFSSQQQLIDRLKQQLTGNEVLLVKGSRAQKMENIVAALVKDFRK